MWEDDEDGMQRSFDNRTAPTPNRPRETESRTDGTTHELLVSSPTAVSYECTVTGDIERLDETSETDSTERIGHDDGRVTVRSTVGDGLCETYAFSGEITAFSPQYGDITLLKGGRPVTPRELTATAGRGWSSASVGGGHDYPETVAPTEATVTVSTADELRDALADASPGAVVYVAGDADIDAGTSTLRVPSGVTLASDRGIDAAPGGRISTAATTWPMLTVDADARITGLRLGGPHDTFVEYDSDAVGLGLEVTGSGVEIDNCECSGFAAAAIRCGADTHVHHSYLHHIPMEEVGTAIRCTGGHPRIEYNYVNYTRHAVTATGDGGYSVAYNHVRAETLDAAFSVSPPGGTALEIHHNTVETDDTPVVKLRGTPAEVTVANNWFDIDGNEAPASDRTLALDTTATAGDSRMVELVNNHYGSDAPSRDIGHPR